MGLFSKKEIVEEKKVEQVSFDHAGLRSEFTELSRDLYNGRQDPGFQRLWKCLKIYRDLEMIKSANLPYTADEKTAAYQKGVAAGMTVFLNTVEAQMNISLASEQKGEVKQKTKKKIWSRTSAGSIV